MRLVLVATFIIGCMVTPAFAGDAPQQSQLTTVISQNLGDFVGFIKEAANTLTTTAKQEVPLYIKELLGSKAYSVKVSMWTYGIWTLLVLLLSVTCIICGASIKEESSKDFCLTVGVIGILILFFTIIVGVFNVPDWMRELYNLQHAPRVVLVEYLKDFIK